jgi:hypothetical protein
MDIRTTAERNNLIQQMNGMLQGERAITLGAIPGREFDIIAHDGSRLIVQLYFIRVGGVHRLCELTAGGFSVSPDNRDVLRFFHSLQMDATVSPPVIAGNPAVRGSKPPDVKLPKASPRRKPKTLP